MNILLIIFLISLILLGLVFIITLILVINSNSKLEGINPQTYWDFPNGKLSTCQIYRIGNEYIDGNLQINYRTTNKKIISELQPERTYETCQYIDEFSSQLATYTCVSNVSDGQCRGFDGKLYNPGEKESTYVFCGGTFCSGDIGIIYNYKTNFGIEFSSNSDYVLSSRVDPTSFNQIMILNTITLSDILQFGWLKAIQFKSTDYGLTGKVMQIKNRINNFVLAPAEDTTNIISCDNEEIKNANFLKWVDEDDLTYKGFNWYLIEKILNYCPGIIDSFGNCVIDNDNENFLKIPPMLVFLNPDKLNKNIFSNIDGISDTDLIKNLINGGTGSLYKFQGRIFLIPYLAYNDSDDNLDQCLIDDMSFKFSTPSDWIKIPPP